MTSKTITSRRTRLEAGQVYGRLTAVAFVRMDKNNQRIWKFWCDCGNTHETLAASVRRGSTRSCGRLSRETSAANGRENVTHGMCGSPEYEIWCGMIKRCENPNNHAFHRYGARGIYVCDRWRESFEAFYADMGDRPSNDHSIDRIKNEGSYCKQNCKWSTWKEQNRNRRNSRMVIANGIEMPLAEAAERAGLDYKTVYGWLRRGWNISRAIGVAR